jgi:hypothetical protein
MSEHPSGAVPFPAKNAPVVTVDQAKIDLVRELLARLENGEQFAAMAILVADGHGYESFFDGAPYEIIVAATRLIHRMNRNMDLLVD